MIDTHSHLFVEEFSDDLRQTIQRAKDAGVTYIFMPNIDDTTISDMLRVCSEFPGYCFPMLGFHPTSVNAQSMSVVKDMKRLLDGEHPYIAIGEVGMDLYWDKTYLKEQQRVFDEQIQWALEYQLPLVIHCREAFPELFEVLKPYKDTELSGVFHSFTGTQDEADELMEYTRFMIGVNGVVTFKKSSLPGILQSIPLNRLVLETDSPYLAPTPYRGKRNESSYIVKVAEKLAELYEMGLEDIKRQTLQNALKVFKRADKVFKVY